MRNGTIGGEIVSRNIGKWHKGENCGVDKMATADRDLFLGDPRCNRALQFQFGKWYPN